MPKFLMLKYVDFFYDQISEIIHHIEKLEADLFGNLLSISLFRRTYVGEYRCPDLFLEG